MSESIRSHMYLYVHVKKPHLYTNDAGVAGENLHWQSHADTENNQRIHIRQLKHIQIASSRFGLHPRWTSSEMKHLQHTIRLTDQTSKC